MSVPRKITPEPYQPEPKPVPSEPKVAPQKPAAHEPKVPKVKPEPEAPKVEPTKKTPEAPEQRGKVVTLCITTDQLERLCVIQSVFLVVLIHVAVI